MFHFNLKVNKQAIYVFKLNEFFTRKNFYTTDNYIDFIINFYWPTLLPRSARPPSSLVFITRVTNDSISIHIFSDWSMRETIVSGVSCAPTARPTASLLAPYLAQTKSVLCIFHMGTAVTTRLIVSFLEALQVRIKATMARKRLRQVKADLTVLFIQPGGELRDQTMCQSPGLVTMPCLRADFAFFHASYSRGTLFERVNLRRTVRHFRRRTDNWSFHQYIESPVRPCPRRGVEWSHAATSFRLAARTVSSKDPADLAQSSSSRSLVSSRCLRSLSLLSRFVFQEGLLALPLLAVFTG